MHSLIHRDDVVLPKSLIQHRNEMVLDGLGDATLLILQFIQPNDLYPVLVTSKYLCLSKLANGIISLLAANKYRQYFVGEILQQ
jgi:hypothetical protein